MKTTVIRERRTGREQTERVPAGFWLAVVYHPLIRPWLGWILFGRAWCSRWLGRLARTSWSRRRIARFIRKYDVDVGECAGQVDEFASFNDFFIRRLRPECRPCDWQENVLVCPADCRAVFLPALEESESLRIKGFDFRLPALLAASPDQVSRLAGGPAMIARLAPVDCHRYYYPAAGRVLSWQAIPGRYDSVHPLAMRRRDGILAANSRRVSWLDLTGFGAAAMIEVGAFAVADIVQTHEGREFDKLQEKGYFNLGGSTIVLLLQPGAVDWDRDLLDNSAAGIETKLPFGERIGERQT